MNAINETLKTLVSSELNTAKSKVHSITKSDRNKLNYLPIEYCNDMLLHFGTELARQILVVLFDHIENGNEKTKELETKVETLSNALEKTNDELIATKIEMDKSNQFGRREMIRLHNIKEPTLSEGDHENVQETVKSVLEAANIDIDDYMISSAQRLPVKRVDGKDVKTKPITFKLTRRFDRNRILRSKKKQMRENTEFQAKYPQAFMTEDLIPLRQHMAFILRTDESIETSWSIDGRLKCLKKNRAKDSKPITIDSPYDLAKTGYSKGAISTIIQQNLFNKNIKS